MNSEIILGEFEIIAPKSSDFDFGRSEFEEIVNQKKI